MAWNGIEEQGEAITLMIHHLHALGPQKSAPLLAPPRHVYEIPENVSLAFHRKSMLMIQQDSGDEVLMPEIKPQSCQYLATNLSAISLPASTASS
jgi:hypothetical protein